jgi:hypothetical protein
MEASLFDHITRQHLQQSFDAFDHQNVGENVQPRDKLSHLRESVVTRGTCGPPRPPRRMP